MLLRSITAAVLCLTLLVACGDTTPSASVVSVAIPGGDLVLVVGQSVVLSTQVTVTGGASPSLAWTTSDHEVATVSTGGRVDAKAAGTATITAASTFDDTKRASILVTVSGSTPRVLGVTIDQGDRTIVLGQAFTFTATVTVEGGANTSVVWSTSDAAVASVDIATGEVTAEAPGSATITATSTFDETKSGSVTVTVEEDHVPPDVDLPDGPFARSERRPDAGYARLTQARVRLESGRQYHFSITFLDGFRSGPHDHVPNLEASIGYNGVTLEVEGTNKRYVDGPGYTILQADVEVPASGLYTLRLPIWHHAVVTFRDVSLRDDSGHELIKNGDFEQGLAYWTSDAYDRTTWLPNLAAAREPPPPFPSPTEDRSQPFRCTTTVPEALAFTPTELDGQTVEYGRFDGAVESLRLIEGHRLTLLVPAVPAFDDAEVREIACRLSEAWTSYEAMTATTPVLIERQVGTAQGTAVIRRPTIAAVQSTCGGACGFMGATGIELGPSVWARTLENYRLGRESSAVPEYEMGRNFWRFGHILQSPILEESPYHLAVAFANVLGHLAGVASGNPQTPGNENVDWLETHRDAFYWYRHYPDFEVLALGGILAQKVQGGLWLHLHDAFGSGFLPAFFGAVAEQPEAADLTDALTNYVVAASIAAGTDLSDWFEVSLDFPHLPNAAQRIASALAR